MAMDLKTWLNDVLRKYVHHREDKVCVVSIVGKSPNSGFWNKVNPVNDIVGRKAFENLACLGRKNLDCGSNIEAYFDGALQVVFFHLIGPYDLSLQKELGPPAEGEDFHTWWAKRDEMYAVHLYTLFITSHIVLLMHPTCRLDTSYFRLFRTLECLRDKTQGAICEILSSTTGVSKGWAVNGRLCAPRLLFGFHRPPTFMKADGTVETRQGPYRKVERCLEDQIYGLFRKSRVITNNTNNALLALPANQSFVYVFPQAEEPRDFIQDLLNNFRAAATTRDHVDGLGRGGDNGSGFKEFLLEHIDLAHSEGFNDNLGKIGPSFFELPKLKTLVRTLSVIYDYLVVKYQENTEMEDIPDMLDVTRRFSEARCKKVYPLSLSAYMDGLPQFYSSRYHQVKLAQALQVLHFQARGPSLETARLQLIEECEQHWRNGHQACEALSLTGNPCINRIHRTSESSEDVPEDSAAPVLSHSSKIKYLSTCNCGRRQAWRNDPFQLREANYEFYEWREEFECCRRRIVDRIDYPTYTGHQDEPEDTESSDEREKDNAEVDTKRITDSTEMEGQKSTRTTKNMFDQLNLATQSQEERNDERGASAGQDLLPDRDNWPEPNERIDQSGRSLADVAELGNANAGTFGEQDLPEGAPVKTQEEPRQENAGGNLSTFASLLDSDESGVVDLRASDDEESEDSANVPGAGSENEEPMGDGDEDKEEEERERRPLEECWPETHRPRLVEDTEAREGVDYLAGMVHSLCRPSLLPLFSSWSLVCIGSSSLYSHSYGLRDQPNFTHGSNFLLPWDVELQVDVERWQEQTELMAISSLKRVGPYKKPRQPKKGSSGAVTVKVFVGFEYECPRGHRFMLQTPDRILKHALVSGTGPKDNGGILVKSDMPLWFQCSCRQAKSGAPGQLMRLHVVTPKAPVIVTINPRVQAKPSVPGNPPLIFHPGAPGPAKLSPAQYWILRFPFIYIGPDGPCYSPRDGADCTGRLLRGIINVFPDLEQ